MHPNGGSVPETGAKEAESRDIKSPETSRSPFVAEVILLTTLLAQGDVVLASPAGHLARAFGAVCIDEERAKTGDTFESGATVTTGERGFSVLKFDDGQVIALRAKSLLVIDDYAYEEGNVAGNRSRTSLLRGGLRALSGDIGKENQEAVSFHTPVATLGIRGTELVVAVKEVNPSNDEWLCK